MSWKRNFAKLVRIFLQLFLSWGKFVLRALDPAFSSLFCAKRFEWKSPKNTSEYSLNDTEYARAAHWSLFSMSVLGVFFGGFAPVLFPCLSDSQTDQISPHHTCQLATCSFSICTGMMKSLTHSSFTIELPSIAYFFFAIIVWIRK